MREMVGAVVILLVMTGVLVGVTRGCSFDPGAPEANREDAPSVDASAKLAEAAGTVPFAVRRPTLPADWKANSSSTAQVGKGAAASYVVRVGWLTPGGGYVQLSQSGARPADVLATETGESSRRTGTEPAGGTRWDVYPSRRDEVAWVTSLDGVVLLITGSADETDFRRLAEAVLSAKALPR